MVITEIESIVSNVADEFGIGVSELFGSGRERVYNDIRFCIYHILYFNYDVELLTLAKVFSKHYASIMNGVRKMSDLKDRELFDIYLRVLKVIEG